MTGYIYKITNTINQKAYIGKTVNSIEQRWKEHRKDYKRKQCEKRPLYDAMNKYGIENFTIELIEEVDIKELSDKEVYWIGYYDTYKNGYNATLGGDGKILYDYDLVAELIISHKTTKEICAELGCCPDIVRLVANKYNLKISRAPDCMHKPQSVNQYDKMGQYLRTFDSIRDACRWLEENGYVSGHLNGVTTHISDACKGKRKTAYKFKWEYN